MPRFDEVPILQIPPARAARPGAPVAPTAHEELLAVKARVRALEAALARARQRAAAAERRADAAEQSARTAWRLAGWR